MHMQETRNSFIAYQLILITTTTPNNKICIDSIHKNTSYGRQILRAQLQVGAAQSRSFGPAQQSITMRPIDYRLIIGIFGTAFKKKSMHACAQMHRAF